MKTVAFFPSIALFSSLKNCSASPSTKRKAFYFLEHSSFRLASILLGLSGCLSAFIALTASPMQGVYIFLSTTIYLVDSWVSFYEQFLFIENRAFIVGVARGTELCFFLLVSFSWHSLFPLLSIFAFLRISYFLFTVFHCYALLGQIPSEELETTPL